MIAPVVPTFPKPSTAQEPVPKVAGPAVKSPLSASCQHPGRNTVKATSVGTVKAPQGFNTTEVVLAVPPPFVHVTTNL